MLLLLFLILAIIIFGLGTVLKASLLAILIAIVLVLTLGALLSNKN